VPAAKLECCSKCHRFTKKFRNSKCVGCPGKPVRGAAAVGPTTSCPPVDQPPDPPIDSLRARVVQRNVPNGSAYSLRAITAKTQPPADVEPGVKRTQETAAPRPKTTHAGKKKKNDDDDCGRDDDDRPEEVDDDGDDVLRRPSLVKWEGYPLWQASWEIEDDLTQAAIDEYWARRTKSGLKRLAPRAPSCVARRACSWPCARAT